MAHHTLPRVFQARTSRAVGLAFEQAGISRCRRPIKAANGRDSYGNGNKFITPVVANGMVFVGTPNGVAVFGLL